MVSVVFIGAMHALRAGRRPAVLWSFAEVTNVSVTSIVTGTRRDMGSRLY